MSFLHLFIVNKSGGLIHHRPLSKLSKNNSSSNHNKIGTNEWLRIASTFHSLYAIAAEASPIRLPNNKNLGRCFLFCLIRNIMFVLSSTPLCLFLSLKLSYMIRIHISHTPFYITLIDIPLFNLYNMWDIYTQ